MSHQPFINKTKTKKHLQLRHEQRQKIQMIYGFYLESEPRSGEQLHFTDQTLLWSMKEKQAAAKKMWTQSGLKQMRS